MSAAGDSSAGAAAAVAFAPTAFLHAAEGWLDEDALARAPMDAAHRRALLTRGLLTDALARTWGETVSVERVGHRPVEADGIGTAVRRDVIIRAGAEICAMASTLMPVAAVRAHPWLDALGNRALGETLKARLGVERGAYAFHALEGTGVMTWARRYPFALAQGTLLVVEFFPSRVLARLGAHG